MGHTFGPLDGSIYATVRGKKSPGEQSQGGNGVVISSVHTVSMDSGISSAGNGLLNQPAPATHSSYPDHHRALDELLTDMLLTVENIPDLPEPVAVVGSAEAARDRDAVDCRPARTADHDIPYHARQDSRPFTYGSVPSGSGEMLRSQSGLSSPSLVRKASFKESVSSSPVHVNGGGSLHRDVRRSNSSHSVPVARSPDFHEG